MPLKMCKIFINISIQPFWNTAFKKIKYFRIQITFNFIVKFCDSVNKNTLGVTFSK